MFGGGGWAGWVAGARMSLGGGRGGDVSGDVSGEVRDMGGHVFVVCKHPKGCVFLRETEGAPIKVVDKEEGGDGQRLRVCGQS